MVGFSLSSPGTESPLLGGFDKAALTDGGSVIVNSERNAVLPALPRLSVCVKPRCDTLDRPPTHHPPSRCLSADYVN